MAQHLPVISNWRAAHAYPLNTFQATLRNKLARLGLSNKRAPVGQRLKRLPSVTKKLQRFPRMNLQQMQDIAGLRAVVPSMLNLRDLFDAYTYANFAHELRDIDDYVQDPKGDGYRSIHLIYRYQNYTAPEYDGLLVELQIRTKLQHAWATAVETVDAFANQAIKAGQESPIWGDFFRLASGAFALQERSPLPGYLDGNTLDDIVAQLRNIDARHKVLTKLRGFSVAANHIHTTGRSSAAWHLVTLNIDARTVRTQQFALHQLPEAMEAYAGEERLTEQGLPVDAVLIAGGSVEQLRRTYPNYFLDASEFRTRLTRIVTKE